MNTPTTEKDFQWDDKSVIAFATEFLNSRTKFALLHDFAAAPAPIQIEINRFKSQYSSPVSSVLEDETLEDFLNRHNAAQPSSGGFIFIYKGHSCFGRVWINSELEIRPCRRDDDIGSGAGEAVTLRFKKTPVSTGWEIVSFMAHYGEIVSDFSEPGRGIDRYLNDYHYSINSVRRLSDMVVFSIGNEVRYQHDSSTHQFTICKFKIEHGIMWATDLDGWANIEAIQKAPVNPPKPILFRTLDGKDIREGDEYWCLQSEWFISHCTTKDYDPSLAKKRFSTKEKANEFIIMNRPVLSVNDTWDYFKKFIHPGDKEKVLERLKELANKKINQ